MRSSVANSFGKPRAIFSRTVPIAIDTSCGTYAIAPGDCSIAMDGAWPEIFISPLYQIYEQKYPTNRLLSEFLVTQKGLPNLGNLLKLLLL